MATISSKFALPSRYTESIYSVWVEFRELAAETNPVNLGQGFPDYPPPKHVPEALAEVALSKNPLLHQYTRGFGHPRLVNALAKLYSKILNRDLDPNNEFMVSCGAYEALYCAVLGHVDVGDEVIIIEPFFDCYEAMVRCAGGTPRFIALKNTNKTGVDITSGDWKLDEEELRGLFNDKTKIIMLNTPHNPLGKVFTEKELRLISELCIKHNVLCLSDEVYEWIVYKPAKHIRIASLPGMWERTLTVGSAGKTFSVTGWKSGWIYGSNELMENVRIVHQNNIYAHITPIQEALARCFELELNRFGTPECYFNSIVDELTPKRDYFMKILKDSGLTPTVPEGGYFVLGDWTGFENKVDLSAEKDTYKDFRFAKWMSRNLKLQGIPPSAFYSEKHKPLGVDYIRFCFFKRDETLEEAGKILTLWSQSKL